MMRIMFSVLLCRTVLEVINDWALKIFRNLFCKYFGCFSLYEF
jgi:hypothetical protein